MRKPVLPQSMHGTVAITYPTCRETGTATKAPTAAMAHDLLDEGIYVVGFSYPVVPQGAARIRVQLSAAHTKEHIEQAVAAFINIGKKYKVIG